MASQPDPGQGGDEFKVELDLPVDDEKMRQIQECLKNGKLKITVSTRSIAGSRSAGPYLYD
jgi:hypothetical protein